MDVDGEEFEFCGHVVDETDLAYLVFDGVSRVWLPKSQVINRRQVSWGDCEFTVPLWLACEKGIA